MQCGCLRLISANRKHQRRGVGVHVGVGFREIPKRFLHRTSSGQSQLLHFHTPVLFIRKVSQLPDVLLPYNVEQGDQWQRRGE
jgi:hypothetical protein